MGYTHFKDGKAIMVDVGGKTPTKREAIAIGSIKVNKEIMDRIIDDKIEKGDVLGVARVAGIMGVKKTHELIPMCHPLMITGCNIEFYLDKEENIITAEGVVKVDGKTGVEMEALQMVTTALLTIYDMCKAIDKGMEIRSIYLKEKTGGKSGHYQNNR